MAYTYDQLMSMLRDFQAQNGATTRPTLWGGPGGEGGSFSYLGDETPNNTWDNGQTGAGGVSYSYDPATNSFRVAEGDMQAGGIQSYGVDPSGTRDLGYEARQSTWGKIGDSLQQAAPYLLAGAGLAAGGVGLMGLTGAGAGATGAGAGGLFAEGATPALLNEAGGAYAFGGNGLAAAAPAAGATGAGAASGGLGLFDEPTSMLEPLTNTGMTTGPMPGDLPPGVTTPDGGIDYGKLSQLASTSGGIESLLSQYPNLSKLLPGLVGAAAGALGSGPMTSTGTQTSSISDPAFETYRNDTLNTVRDAARQPYAAPGFSLTQGDRPEQTQAAGYFGDFASGARDVTSATNPLAAENNPYITGVISAGARDMTDAYGRLVAPTYAGSSSFGNRNMGEYENADRSNLMMRIGDLSGSMRMQDHNLRAQLLESGAARTDQINNANANRGLQGATGLANVGGTLWNQGQQNIENQYTEFQRQQLWNRQGAQLMTAGLSAPYNRTGSTSQTTPGNRAAGAVGGFTVGMQAGNLFNGQPVGGTRTARTAGSLFG